MVSKLYAYGLYNLFLTYAGYIPSVRLRRGIYRGVFKLRITNQSVIYGGAKIRSPSRISIQSGSSIGHRCELDGRGCLNIGENVNISSEVMIWTAQHNYNDSHFETTFAPVTLEDFCWIGPRAIILPGVTVARGSVIAAGSVVTKSTDACGVYAGVPAVLINRRVQHPDFNYCPAMNYIPFI